MSDRNASTISILLLTAAIGSCSSPTGGPDPSEPASVAVEPGSSLLTAVGDTVDLTATVRNGASEPVSAGVTWSVAPAGIVTVDASGRVIAEANGQATLTATAGSVSGSAEVTVRQAVDSVEAGGDAQGADVGAPLDSAIVVTLLDARGRPVRGAPVVFTVVSGGGSVSPTSSTTGADGSASVSWTLGATSGVQELDAVGGFEDEATRRFSASGFALGATDLATFGGDGQSELVLTDLAEPLAVQVLDSLGNGVPDIPVTFTADGDAALEADEVLTDLDGVARVGLTLGSTLGDYAVTATVPDSLTASGMPLEGAPVTLTAHTVAYWVATVDELVVGDTATITGTGFHPALASNTVLLGGTPVAIVGGSQTELRIEVPEFGCTPQRALDLDVSRVGAQVVQAVTVTPAGALELAVGEHRILTDDEAYCLQFLPSTNDEYLVGLTSTSWFDGGATFAVTALDSTGPFPSPSSSPGAALAGRRVFDASTSVRSFDGDAGGVSGAELRLRENERVLVDRLVGALSGETLATSSTTGGTLARAPAAAGDQLDLRLPDLRGDPCLEYVPLGAEVFSVGERLVLATTEPLPSAVDPARAILSSAAEALHASFGDTGVDRIVSFLGAPTTWDADSRVTVVLTPQVSQMGVSAYASAVDELPRSLCPSSDEGHVVYVTVPDAATVAELVGSLDGAPAELTHQIAHVVQWARRLPTGGNLLPSWLAEGQAELVVEHVGLVLAGLGSQQDLGASVLGTPGLSEWIQERFDRLARYGGWDGGTGVVEGAPEQCSLFGYGGSASPCGPEAAPGASWSFLRYLSDRFAPVTAGGEGALQRAMVELDPTVDVLEQLEAMLGVHLADLMVEWAAALYADGRLTPSEAPELQVTSWKLLEMLPVGPMRLDPPSFGFSDFTREGTIVGGGTAYTLVGSGADHGSLAVRIGDGAGGPVPAALRPRTWVVRMR